MCAAWLAFRRRRRQRPMSPLGDPASFRVDKATLRAERSIGGAHRSGDRARPALLPPAGAASSRRTCREFGDLRWRLPAVAVHGDAHLEQFVVTGRASAWGTSTCRASARRSWTWCATPRRCTWPVARCHGPVTATRLSRPTSPPITRRIDHPVERTRPTVVERLRRLGPAGTRDVAGVGRHADEAAAGRRGNLPARRLGTLHRLMLETRPERPHGVLSARAGRPDRDGYRQRARTEDPGANRRADRRRRTTT